MLVDNKISFQLGAEEQTKVEEALTTLETTLLPKLLSLNAEERKGILHLGDKSLSFTEKALEVAKQNKNLYQAFVDVDEFSLDMQAISQFRSLNYRLAKINEMLQDSETEAGHEAYKAALQVYALTKNAAKLGHPGSEAMVQELKSRFPSKRKKNDN